MPGAACSWWKRAGRGGSSRRRISSGLFAETREAPKRLPKAALETLAVIAYHQPVTRAEIEDIRGVSLSRGSMELLLEIGWIRPRGRRRTPGRPLTFGTTDAFLSQFGLASLDALPGKDDLKGLGLLDPRAAAELGRAAPERGAGAATKNRCQKVTTRQAFSWIIWNED